MKASKRKLNNRGQGLIQALVAIGIMSIGATAIMSLISDQNKQTRALSEKLAKLDLEKQVTATLLDGPTCSSFLTSTSQTLDSNNLTNQIIDYLQIKASSSATAPNVVKVGDYLGSGHSQKISKIFLGGFSSSGSADKYVAKLNISFDPTSTVLPMKDITLNIMVYTDPTTPAASKKITGCTPSGTAGNCYTFSPYSIVGWKYSGVQKLGCPDGEYLNSFQNDHWKNGLQYTTSITCCALPGNSPTVWTATSDYSAYK